MHTNYSRIVAREIKEATIEIYGGIGDKVNGDNLAGDINYMDKNADRVVFRINSLGGNFVQGLSVISAITGAKAQTIGFVEGIAGSMAAFIALSCTRVKMNDFARIMLHAPYYIDVKGDKVVAMTEDEKEAIESLKGIVVDLLSRRGKSKTDIESILTKDTWYTAEEALAEGFIDEIIDTGVATTAAGLSIDNLVAFAMDNGNKDLLTNNDTMKKIAAKLGLPETSDEQAIVAALDQKDTNLMTARKSLIDGVIAAGKRSGTVTDINEAQIRRLAEADLDLCIEFVVKPAAVAADNTRLSDVIAKLSEGIGRNGDKNDEKDWDWYQKNDSVGLQKMRTAEPEKYNKLYATYWGGDVK